MLQMAESLAVLATALGLLAAAPEAAKEKYSMADLKALVEGESWAEALEHLTDVPPARRDKTWSSYLVQAATGHLKAIETSGQGYQALGLAEGFLIQYPALKKSRPYMERRAEVGLKAFEGCLVNAYAGPQCIEELEKFVAADPTNDDLAFRAGRMARLHAGFRPAARLFEQAFQRKARRKDCNDEQVVLAIGQTLGNTTHAPTLASARKVAFDYCWPALKKSLLETFHDADKTYLETTCPDLTQKKALSKFQGALCKDTVAAK